MTPNSEAIKPTAETTQNGLRSIREIIAAGVARFEETLPIYTQTQAVETYAPGVVINLTLSEEKQMLICLNCPLTDCVGIERKRCPIRIEQRRVWRDQRQRN